MCFLARSRSRRSRKGRRFVRRRRVLFDLRELTATAFWSGIKVSFGPARTSRASSALIWGLFLPQASRAKSEHNIRCGGFSSRVIYRESGRRRWLSLPITCGAHFCRDNLFACLHSRVIVAYFCPLLHIFFFIALRINVRRSQFKRG